MRLLAVAALGLATMITNSLAAGGLPSDTPSKFVRSTESFDYDTREVMIPMRDGVKLKTVILIPKGAKGAPMLLTRTPYDAVRRVRSTSTRLAAAVPAMDETAVASGYIIVMQDIRGKYGSGGDYVMTRPLRGPLNPTEVDPATDAYDTIDWLVKNVPESNGRLGTIGGSYDGFTALMSTVHPHPALKVTVAFSPMVDTWIGDDSFHNGAFRQAVVLPYLYAQEATRNGSEMWWSGTRDTYQDFLQAGSAGAMATLHGMDQLGFWRELAAHPAYDQFWQDQAVDKWLANQPLTVPLMLVDALFDQEDIYGGPAVYRALAPKDPNGRLLHFVLGPWSHGQARGTGRGIGPIHFEGDTAAWFRRTIMQPFLDYYLKDGRPPHTPRVLAYETGANEWHRYESWPRACETGCPARSHKLYLVAGGKLGFEPPSSQSASGAYDEYISDPAKPVPYRASRPTLLSDAPDSTWAEWLVDDQRNAASRPDVLVYETPTLTAPLRIAGAPVAELYASTSGSDSDWVVKLIDVWPDESPAQPALAGYQLMISADIFRGRYRTDLARAHPIPANRVLLYRFRLPNVSHTFLPGHRIMVQIQSSWFPLYDRNPQKFVPNIMNAEPQDYVKATQRIWHEPGQSSAIELPIIPGGPLSATDPGESPENLVRAR